MHCHYAVSRYHTGAGPTTAYILVAFVDIPIGMAVRPRDRQEYVDPIRVQGTVVVVVIGVVEGGVVVVVVVVGGHIGTEFAVA